MKFGISDTIEAKRLNQNEGGRKGKRVKRIQKINHIRQFLS